MSIRTITRQLSQSFHFVSYHRCTDPYMQTYYPLYPLFFHPSARRRFIELTSLSSSLMADPERLVPIGTLEGHTSIVTAIATPSDSVDEKIVTSSSDKSVMIRRLSTPGTNSSDTTINNPSAPYGYPIRRLTGHSHLVQDVALSSTGQFAVSASWDSELRLWNLHISKSTPSIRVIGHEKSSLSVSLSSNNRLIASGSRDRTLKL
ncbi:hypothetical protein Ancab_034829 [Ancistrocladus abbreviatus]